MGIRTQGHGLTVILGALLLGVASTSAIANDFDPPLVPEEPLHVPGLDHHDSFGFSVAAEPGRLIVGARTGGPRAAGVAYVFEDTNGSWELAGAFSKTGGVVHDFFGWGVAIAGDLAAASAPFHDGVGENSGAVYVFERWPAPAWVQTAELTASDGVASHGFGRSLAMSGTVIVVGAPNDHTLGGSAGAAYIYEWNGADWVETKITAADASTASHFGTSVAIDGQRIVVGASSNSHVATAAGAAYVFEKHGGSWQQTAKLTANDADAFDHFGISVAVSGSTILAGADSEDVKGYNSGSAYVFDLGDSGWAQSAKLSASDGSHGDRLGRSVAISGDTAVVGAALDDNDSGEKAGSACAYTRTGNRWLELARLDASDGSGEARFGTASAVAGTQVVVGSPYHRLTPTEVTGAAYVYTVGGIGTITCTIVGTDGDDIIQGTSGADVICGLGGDDVIYGNRGGDIIRGGAGNDVIYGGYGLDWIFGQEGNDRLTGGAQPDTILGGPGHDILRGKGGDDWLEANKGDDALYGSVGDDTLNGGRGFDDCDGGLGTNTLFGCDGH